MLVISRRENEAITIEPARGLDPELTLREAFRQGAIEIRLIRINGNRVRLAISAPAEMKIWRGAHNADGSTEHDPLQGPSDSS
jgi:hypothetical protein